MVPFFGYCQDLSIKIVANPNYSYRRLKVDSDADFKPEGEKGILGYDVGFSVMNNFTKYLALESGVLYSRMGTGLGKYIIENSNKPSEVQRRFNFLSIPLRLGVNLFPERRISPVVKAGITNSWLLDEYDYISNVGRIEIDKSYTRKYQLGISVGSGIIVDFGNSFEMSFIPNLNYMLFSTRKDDVPFKRNLYSIGIELGLIYKI
jgi:hypothetical protein